jgi:hypothetical protein
VVFFDVVVLPLPSLELCVSVVLSVPGDGTAACGTDVLVDDVVLDVVVCAGAAPAIRSMAQEAAAKYFTVKLHCFGTDADPMLQKQH